MLTLQQFINDRLASLRQSYVESPPLEEQERAGYRAFVLMAEVAARHGECPQPGSPCADKVPVRTRSGEPVCIEAANLGRMWLDHEDYYRVAIEGDAGLPMMTVTVDVQWTGVVRVPVSIDPSQFPDLTSTDTLDYVLDAAHARTSAILDELRGQRGFRHRDDVEAEQFRVGRGTGMNAVTKDLWEREVERWFHEQRSPWYEVREQFADPDSVVSTTTTSTTTLAPEGAA